MGKCPCCDGVTLKKGPWTPEEDERLVGYIGKHGKGKWRYLPSGAGINRCAKSCRLRWMNYLRPGIKKGKYSEEEDRCIINLHSEVGNKWSTIAGHLAGRTDNEVKNHWNTHLKKRLLLAGVDPVTHRRLKPDLDSRLIEKLSNVLTTTNLYNLATSWDNALRMQVDAAHLTGSQILQTLVIQAIISTSGSPSSFEAIPDQNSHYSNDLISQLARQLSLTFAAMAKTNNFQDSCDPSLPIVQQQEAPHINSPCLNYGLAAKCENDFGNQMVKSNSIDSTATSDPQIDDQMQADNVIANSSTGSSAIFESWEELIGDMGTDLAWKDILELANYN